MVNAKSLSAMGKEKYEMRYNLMANKHLFSYVRRVFFPSFQSFKVINKATCGIILSFKLKVFRFQRTLKSDLKPCFDANRNSINEQTINERRNKTLWLFNQINQQQNHGKNRCLAFFLCSMMKAFNCVILAVRRANENYLNLQRNLSSKVSKMRIVMTLLLATVYLEKGKLSGQHCQCQLSFGFIINNHKGHSEFLTEYKYIFFQTVFRKPFVTVLPEAKVSSKL